MRKSILETFRALLALVIGGAFLVCNQGVAFAQYQGVKVQPIRPAMPSVLRPGVRRGQSQPTFNPTLTDLPIYNVAAYANADTCSGPSVDDEPQVQAAINAAEASGGPAVVLIPYQHCYIRETLNVTASNIHVRGFSNGLITNGADVQPGTEITWSTTTCGPSVGPMFNYGPAQYKENPVYSSDLSDVYLDGGGGLPNQPPCAGKGIVITSVQGGHWSDISADTFSQFFIECTVDQTLNGTPQESSIHNVFDRLNVQMTYQSNTGVGIFFTAPAPIPGKTVFDCNQNTVENSYFAYANGSGAMFWTSDHNVLFNDQFYPTVASGGTNWGVKFGCGSNFNIGYNGNPATIMSNGTAECQTASNAAHHNRWVDLPSCPDPNYPDNSSDPPKTQPGATFSWTDNCGGSYSAGP